MVMEKEDLRLSLSLSSSSNTHLFPPPDQLTLMSSSTYSASQPNSLSLPFSCHQKPSQWSHDLLLLAHSEKRPTLDVSGGAGDTRSLFRGIDMNQAPSMAVGEAERDSSEEEAAASSPNSTVSSASDKRTELETSHAGGDEHDVDYRACSRGICDEEDGEGSRKKLRLSKDQSAILEESFKEHHTLNPKQKLALAKQLNLRPRQVEVWFQNRRARTKLKQTEVDCEFLKRCCENLTEENRRLQKEVQELRALKLSPQFYMHMTPPTTLTMCPSCERVSNSTTNTTTSNSSSSFSTNLPLPEHPQLLRHHRPVTATVPWAPIPLRQSFLDSPQQRS